ncbi:MAG: FHA domain-containing protein [Pseudomonadota bacterium]
MPSCQLEFLSGPRKGTIFRFEQTSFWLGRDPHCELAFDPNEELCVSARHAQITTNSKHYWLSDSSSNGTFINGQKVEQVQLKDGDVLELGPNGPRIRFSIYTHMPLLSVVPTQMQLCIERIPGEQRHVFAQQVVRLGRDPSADVSYDLETDLLVSYNHAKIVLLDNQFVLFDLDSTNGTFVNGQRVTRSILAGGETIELGRSGPKLQVSFSSKKVPIPSLKKDGAGTVFGDAVPIGQLSLGQAELLAEYPMTNSLTIGRSPNCDIVLDSMYVSHHHSTVEKRSHGIFLTDAGSANGTYLNGERITEAPLGVDAEFVIGPYVLKHIPEKILVFDTRSKIWIDSFDLCRVDAKTGRNFLDHISLKIHPNEFVCVLGPSGSGKSTLLKALSGSSRAETGSVLFNNIDFYENYAHLKHHVGYVPQEDIIHSQLSVERTLLYAAKLRLPPGIPSSKRDERIDDVLSMVELHDHRFKPIHKLSGGQRKRVGIAVELLTEPSILFLDEPTSGLDPNLEEKMMLLIKELTLRGKTVLSVTHVLDNIQLSNKIIFLVDGKLVFFGTENEAKEFFSITKLPDAYKYFEEKKNNPDSLRADFEKSPTYERNIRSQLVEPPITGKHERPKNNAPCPGSFRQFWVLTQRYLEIITRDMRNTAILLLQAPLVALFICLAMKSDQPERGPTSTMFMIMSLSALWFGCTNAARELTKEKAIYARERMINLRIIPYIASKFFALQWLALLQVTMMLTIVYFMRSGYTIADPPEICSSWGIAACSTLILDGVPGNFFLHLTNLYLTALHGIGLGLLVSAIAGNSDKAMSLVPLLLIPQVLFSGSFDVPKPNEQIKRAVGYAMALNWSLDQAKRIAMCTPKQEIGNTLRKGCTNCIHAYDPNKHKLIGTEDQDEDAYCKAIVPALGHITDFPESLILVEDGYYTPRKNHAKGPARQSTKSYTGLVVLGVYDLFLFFLACFFVRLKDRKLE